MRNRFETFITSLQKQDGVGNDELVQILLPLLEEIAGFHDAGQVAPLDDLNTLLVTESCLDIDEAFVRQPAYNRPALDALEEKISKAVVDVTDEEIYVAEADGSQEITKPVYLPGYGSYELELGHHDALTDIYLLGLIIASVATGLNFYFQEDFESFIRNRNSLQNISPRLHPALAHLILEMTALDRRKRSRDIREVIHKLKNFREYNAEGIIDLTSLDAYKKTPLADRAHFVYRKLRSRLFDTSRRNRLLYFKSNMRFLNLTVSSFPLSLNLAYVKAEHLFYWNEEVAARVAKGQNLHLNKYLKTDENEYIIPSLDKIRLETQKDIQEYGMSQLRLAIAFLHWYNLKEDDKERISSPFILLPVSIQKRKSLRKDDDFILEINDTEAEINPILRYQLEEVYGIRLPETIDLEETSLQVFYEHLKQAIDTANHGIKIALIDKPRIKMIHTAAQRTATVYARRKNKHQAGMARQYLLDYSYDRDNYQPLGLQLYRTYLQPGKTLLDNVAATVQQPLRFKQLQESIAYEVETGKDNPYLWEFDLCHIVLGNFNYRKMSLVRDYNQVLETGDGAPMFDALFSDKPKEVSTGNRTPVPLGEQYAVIQADPTQLASVLKVRDGQSYIIQGPPGTGKSQTITNLIADLLAHGKKVLFVCEKKAAIDVVYHRLKSKGLHDMCCLIHDSQGDKKAFIANLKETYDAFLKDIPDIKVLEASRDEHIRRTTAQLNLLDELHTFAGTLFEEAGMPVYRMLNRLLEMEQEGTEDAVINTKILPPYKNWLENGEAIIQLFNRLRQRQSGHTTLATHPLRYFNAGAVQKNQWTISEVETQLRTLAETLKRLQELPVSPANISELFVLASTAAGLRSYAQSGHLYLLDADDPRSLQLNQLITEIEELQHLYEQAKADNKAWINKLPKSEAEHALPQIQRYEHSFFKFLNGSWRSISKAIRNSYDFSQRQIKPSLEAVVQNLLQEYKLEADLEIAEKKAAQQFGLADLKADWERITSYRKNTTAAIEQYIDAWKNNPQLVLALSDSRQDISRADDILRKTWRQYDSTGLDTLQAQVEALLQDIQSLPDMLYYLGQLEQAHPDLQQLIRTEAISPAALEKILLKSTLRQLQQRFHSIERLNSRLIEEIAAGIEKSYEELLELNASYIKAICQTQFTDKVKLARQHTSTLTADEKEWKKLYAEGRKVLEHEMGKSRSYKSIRTLAENESGIVLRDLKPVWLMSPLSVSDTLPLGNGYFDVVIFDEASQISLEEGIPTMFRAPQSIIVGDEKQMPPTNFFSSGSYDPDDLTEHADGAGQDTLQLDADSLLTQGARKLDSIMLGWHYRSRSEALISYSNAAFYNGGLLTIPDRTQFNQVREPIVVKEAADARSHIARVFDRTISYHHLPGGIYEERGNIDEATYIAALIREMLFKKTGKTIGIVAFSMEQQRVIEAALEALQATDEAFDQLLEEEYQRSDEGQYTGLFVKNLENVQGDERDIIIISTCYGYNRNGKMFMNFGPINRKGGEKRLNVIFSRAKEHVVVVSSIQFTDIKNEYNEGANFFRCYLEYAQCISNGDMQRASLVLHSLDRRRSAGIGLHIQRLPVVQQIKDFLEREGWQVSEHVGQSVFKVSLAVKSKDDTAFRLALMIDDELHYSNSDVLEQYVQRPAILRNFGWKVMNILTQDWLNNRPGIEKDILKRLSK